MKNLEEFIANCKKNAIPDDQIDYSDCPPLTDEQLGQLQPCHLVKRSAESETVQLDSDVVEKIKKSGSGWQKKLNDFLRKSLASGLL